MGSMMRKRHQLEQKIGSALLQKPGPCQPLPILFKPDHCILDVKARQGPFSVALEDQVEEISISASSEILGPSTKFG